MTTHSHAIVWLDHHKAKIVYFNADDSSAIMLQADRPASHIHSKAGSASGTHLHGDKTYFAEIAKALASAITFVVVGPSSAKDEFGTYLREKQTAIAVRMAGVEPLDKKSDQQLLTFARRYFHKKDRTTPQFV